MDPGAKEVVPVTQWAWCGDRGDHEQHATGTGLMRSVWVPMTYLGPGYPVGRITIVTRMCRGDLSRWGDHA